jgi:hypothetical protein
MHCAGEDEESRKDPAGDSFAQAKMLAQPRRGTQLRFSSSSTLLAHAPLAHAAEKIDDQHD